MNSSHNTFIDFPLKIEAYKREEKNPYVCIILKS